LICAENHSEMVRVTGRNNQIQFWWSKGNTVLTALQRIPKDHGCELIRHKQFYFRHDFPIRKYFHQIFDKQIQPTNL
jgi:hypothetical protein